jgi:hypothetical protein
MDSHAWMGGIDANRAAPMRFQHDQDISFGYMHSGYPIMTFMDVVNSTLDVEGNHWVRGPVQLCIGARVGCISCFFAYRKHCSSEFTCSVRTKG